MGKVVSLEQFKQERLFRGSFAHWPRRLDYTPRPGVRLRDLPDRVLAHLAELDNAATLALYDLVLGVRGLGPAERFSELPSRQRVEALDSFLFLADQVRFELMRRLGWVGELVVEGKTLLEMAGRGRSIPAGAEAAVPQLLPTCPRYQELAERLRYEPAAVVRSLIPEALVAFRRHLAGQADDPA